jgi:FlgD Ig-like domain
VEQDIQQYYESRHPGEVVVIGADLFNCTPSGLGSFRQNTGATFPLLLLSSVNTGGNIQTLYGERDHYVVISKQGIVRYQANDRWPYGDGYYLDEIRGCVDSLLSPGIVARRPPLVREPARRERPGRSSAPTSEPGDELLPQVALRAGPSPSGSAVTIVLANPAGRAVAARVTVCDLAGRRVAMLLDGPAAPGPTTLVWDGRDLEGRAAASGVYQVRAEVAGRPLVRRIALVR